MKQVAMTGGGGFLGWHTRCALHARGDSVNQIAMGERHDATASDALIDGAPRLIHLAGVNRGTEEEVRDGNVLFAEQLVDVLRRVPSPPPIVVYANSTQAENGTVYGDAKARAAEILGKAASDLGLEFVDLRLPNLFGEHGRPFYNAVTATFCHVLAEGGEPTVVNDKELTLLHAQNAADLLIGAVDPSEQAGLEVQETVSGILRRLAGFAQVYASGEIPDIAESFDRDLFNTYRSYTFGNRAEIHLVKRADPRGSFFEMIRARGGEGQSSFSTTVPGVSRGDHYHRRKIERFTVLVGEAVIAVRQLFSSEVREFRVSGDAPVAIDMPTLWPHKITNAGDTLLYTSFWTNELYDDDNPDTIREMV